MELRSVLSAPRLAGVRTMGEHLIKFARTKSSAIGCSKSARQQGVVGVLSFPVLPVIGRPASHAARRDRDRCRFLRL